MTSLAFAAAIALVEIEWFYCIEYLNRHNYVTVRAELYGTIATSHDAFRS
jgi:hypothetical protein